MKNRHADRYGRVVQVFRHDPQRKDLLSNDDVRATSRGSGRSLWVGTADGLNLFDARPAGLHQYAHQESDAALCGPPKYVLYEDSSARLDRHRWGGGAGASAVESAFSGGLGGSPAGMVGGRPVTRLGLPTTIKVDRTVRLGTGSIRRQPGAAQPNRHLGRVNANGSAIDA